jgi:hypothetical protein
MSKNASQVQIHAYVFTAESFKNTALEGKVVGWEEKSRRIDEAKW